MAVPPVAVEFTVEGLEDVKSAFGEVSNASKETRQTVEQDSKVMAAGLRLLGREIFIVAQTGRLVTEFAEQFGILDKEMANALGRGFNLISMMGGLATSLSMLARITQTAAVAEWLHVAALKAKAVAAAIAHGIASLGAALPLIVAAAAAATAIALTATAQVPSKEHGGLIEEAGIYQLHKGELVIPERTVESLQRFSNVMSLESFRELTREIERLTPITLVADQHMPLESLAPLVPSRELGGPVTETGPYKLHAGEYVVSAPMTRLLEEMAKILENYSEHRHLLGGWPTTRPLMGADRPVTEFIRERMIGETKVTEVNIQIHGMTRREAESTSDVVIDKLRRAGVI